MRFRSQSILPAILTAGALLGGFFWMREEVVNRIYREKLLNLSQEYATLADQYNHAIRLTAITELEVTEDSLAVRIRSADGQIRRIPTPYDPKREIFVDYLVGHGRIWIRRVFDQRTPPEQALTIDPAWEEVDWETDGLQYGKVIYRSLQPGIWSIQVSGNGALSLEPIAESRPALLQQAPDLRSFEEIKLSLDRDARDITLKDLKAFGKSFFPSKDRNP